MEKDEFREHGKEMVDFICEYMGNLKTRRVTPNVNPGYLRPLLPESAPQEPEPWDDIMGDVEKFIMPGVRYHASLDKSPSIPQILSKFTLISTNHFNHIQVA